jgi:hypothetical protein
VWPRKGIGFADIIASKLVSQDNLTISFSQRLIDQFRRNIIRLISQTTLWKNPSRLFLPSKHHPPAFPNNPFEKSFKTFSITSVETLSACFPKQPFGKILQDFLHCKFSSELPKVHVQQKIQPPPSPPFFISKRQPPRDVPVSTWCCYKCRPTDQCDEREKWTGEWSGDRPEPRLKKMAVGISMTHGLVFSTQTSDQYHRIDDLQPGDFFYFPENPERFQPANALFRSNRCRNWLTPAWWPIRQEKKKRQQNPVFAVESFFGPQKNKTHHDNFEVAINKKYRPCGA